MTRADVLHEEVLYQHGSYRRVRRYLRGAHPELGQLHRGYTGLETLVEVDVIVPSTVVRVVPFVPVRSGLRAA
jgi:hypothetical protein